MNLGPNDNLGGGGGEYRFCWNGLRRPDRWSHRWAALAGDSDSGAAARSVRGHLGARNPATLACSSGVSSWAPPAREMDELGIDKRSRVRTSGSSRVPRIAAGAGIVRCDLCEVVVELMLVGPTPFTDGPYGRRGEREEVQMTSRSARVQVGPSADLGRCRAGPRDAVVMGRAHFLQAVESARNDRVPAGLIALVLAPLATELPKVKSIIG